jgi:hypothetical protein
MGKKKAKPIDLSEPDWDYLYEVQRDQVREAEASDGPVYPPIHQCGICGRDVEHKEFNKHEGLCHSCHGQIVG